MKPSHPHPCQPIFSRRALLLGAASSLATGCSALAADAPPPRLRLLGETSLPHRLPVQGTTLGGLSALDYNPVDDLWYALCDDRSDINPARFYTLRMKVSDTGITRPEIHGVTFLRQADGSTYPSRNQASTTPGSAGLVPDPEGLRFLPQSRTLLWSSEGDRRSGLDPFIREVSLDGRHVREFTLPPHLRIVGASPQEGPRDNLTLEGLALSPDGHTLWASMEAALIQDGPVPTVSAAGGPCRFTRFDVQTGQPTRQIAYLPDAIPLAPFPAGLYADNGVSEILMASAQHLLVLERSYSVGAGNSLRIYRIDVNEGSDTLGETVLRTGSYRPAPKTLVANFRDTGLQRLDNTEGMAWGPALSGHNAGPARRTLVCVSDDNFNPTQTTQFVAFEYLE